jgi:hypothetical protein
MWADKVAISRASSSVFFMIQTLYTRIVYIASLFFEEFQLFPAAASARRSLLSQKPVSPFPPASALSIAEPAGFIRVGF